MWRVFRADAPPPPAPDALVETLAERLPHLGVYRASRGANAPPDAFIPQVEAAPEDGRVNLLALADGRSLELFPRCPLGVGASARVHVGLLSGPRRWWTGRTRDLVAVKRPLGLQLLARAESTFGSRVAARSYVRDRLRRDLVAEGERARRAGGDAAPLCLTTTPTDSCLVLPLLSATLTDVTDHLCRHLADNDPSWPSWGWAVLADVLPEVRRARARGLAHHDISSENIMVLGRRFALADWGLSCTVPPAHNDARHGTVWCAAPEALVFSGDGAVDVVAGDYFSLGTVALVLASGTRGRDFQYALIDLLVGNATAPGRRAWARVHSGGLADEPLGAEEARIVLGRRRQALATLPSTLADVLGGLTAGDPVLRHLAADQATALLADLELDRSAVARELDHIGRTRGDWVADRLSLAARPARPRRGAAFTLAMRLAAAPPAQRPLALALPEA